MTRSLSTRFLRPTKVGIATTIHAWIVQQRPPLYTLKGEVRQHGQVTAKAKAEFADAAMIHSILEGLKEEPLS